MQTRVHWIYLNRTLVLCGCLLELAVLKKHLPKLGTIVDVFGVSFYCPSILRGPFVELALLSKGAAKRDTVVSPLWINSNCTLVLRNGFVELALPIKARCN